MTGAVGLTARQSQVLQFIRFRASEGPVGPSYTDIMSAAGLTSKAQVHRILTALEERGYIHRMPQRARSVTLGPKPQPKLCRHCGLQP